MVVYLVYGFRWLRMGNLTTPGIRPHIVMNDLLDATSDYIQEPNTARDLMRSFERIEPNISSHLPGLALIEQYDPEDTSNWATGQPYAFVCAKVVAIGDGSKPQSSSFLSLDLESFISEDPGLSPEGIASFSKLRQALGPEEKIRWWMVYNGDPDRFSKDNPEGETESPNQSSDEPEEVFDERRARPSRSNIPPAVPPKPKINLPERIKNN